MKDFFKQCKDPPTWFAQWKEKKAEEMKTKLKSREGVEVAELEGTTAGNTDERKEAEVEREAAQDKDTSLFKKGDIIMGLAVKHREKYAQKGKIVDVLSKHYKEVMLEGPATNEMHKFVHSAVKAIEPQGAGAGALATQQVQQEPSPETILSAASAAETATADGDKAMQAIGDLFEK